MAVAAASVPKTSLTMCHQHVTGVEGEAETKPIGELLFKGLPPMQMLVCQLVVLLVCM
jgi:hypothetical protein